MNNSKHVHFIGIGGYGMSAIAMVMLEMGYQVSGSDLAGRELIDKLIARGAQINIGHEGSHVHGADLVVYSTAVTLDNVEMIAAKKMNIPVIHRAQALARLMNEKEGIAVAGAHGKTTTSSMIAWAMEQCALEPTFVIGGEMMNIGTNAKMGKGKFFVAEADESDGSFLQYHPCLAVVTNIEADHLENYGGDFNRLRQAYLKFLSQVKKEGKAVICQDDPVLKQLIPRLDNDVITYGIESPADFKAADIHYGDRKVEYSVLRNGELCGTIELSVPGKHNVYNSLAAVIVCMELGLEFPQISQALKQFRGAKRRFQVVGEVNGILIVDDYAHHPTEIEATINAAKSTGRKIIAVFQPQRYSRTYYLFEQFSRAFAEADEVIVTDIYSPAGEKQIEGVNSAKLVELVRRNSNARAQYIPTKEEVQSILVESAMPGDLILTMGAGDIWKTSKGLYSTLCGKPE